jgi:serine/threonine-protein kinase
VTFNSDEWIGRDIGAGRYHIVGRIGQGSMGRVYLARDSRLDADVVLKFPVASIAAAAGPEFLNRFAREVRSLVQLSHPHIVKVFDVGVLEGHPFVVMEFLAGKSLKDRIASGPGMEPQPMPPQSLSGWLLEIAKALDFIHLQKHIHRDVKPANILFDRHGNAFLTDFGIIKALASEETRSQENSLTAPGFLVGTPNYVAPEIVMGRPFDGRVDQYSLAMTVHEALSGTNCMEGPTPSATVVNQTMVVPPCLTEMIPAVPKPLSDAIRRGLAKEPGERFENCVSLAQEILAAARAQPATRPDSSTPSKTSQGRPGRVPCPVCGSPMPVGREHLGGHVRCTRCQATSLVGFLSSNTIQLRLVEPPHAASAPVSPIVIESLDDAPEPDPNAATMLARLPEAASAKRQSLSSGPRWLKVAAIGGAAVAGLIAIILLAFDRAPWTRELGGSRREPPESAAVGAESAGRANALTPTTPADPVEINLTFGTEKQQWLEEATAEFRNGPGRGVVVNLHPMGSMEGARAILNGPKPVPFHVWSPASSAYRELFEREWLTGHDNQPISKSENLALTPMVFVMWKSRREPFIKKYARLNFRTIAEAMRDREGWSTIAQRREWGRFNFGHTHPTRSNSGLLTLVLMAYEFAGKERNLDHRDIAEPRFQEWLRTFEQGVARHGGSLTSSTGTLMREMVLRGPSQYDCLLIYENLAIDYLDEARDRWGELHVDYPDPNLWNDHPFYILDVPWSDARQRAAAAEFLKFLMSERIQRHALEHGFRPGNPSVSVRFPESPLIKNAAHGLKIDLPRMCQPPKNEVLQELLASFQRIDE